MTSGTRGGSEAPAPCVGVIGPAARAGLAAGLAARGLRVLGFQLDPDADAVPLPTAGCCDVTADHRRLAEPDALVIASPVALTPARGADCTAIAAAVRAVAGRLRRGQLVVLTEPVPPGTARGVVLPALAATGLAPGHDFLLAHAPASGDTTRAVGGLNEDSARAAADLFARAGYGTARVSSLEAAEVCGTLGGLHRSVQAAALNELGAACGRMGVDAWEVTTAAGIPSLAPLSHDDSASRLLSWGARRWGASFRLLDAAHGVNAAMPAYVVSRVADALNDAGRAVRGSKVAILGLVKKGVDDPRDLPSFELMDHLLKKGARVSHNDPHVPSLPRTGHWSPLEPVESQALTAEYLAAQDCVLIVADHASYDYTFIVTHSRRVVDACNATQAIMTGREKIVRA